MDKMLADLDLTVTSDDDLDLNTDLVTSLATMETLEYANECVVMVSWLRCWFCTDLFTIVSPSFVDLSWSGLVVYCSSIDLKMESYMCVLERRYSHSEVISLRKNYYMHPNSVNSTVNLHQLMFCMFVGECPHMKVILSSLSILKWLACLCICIWMHCL